MTITQKNDKSMNIFFSSKEMEDLLRKAIRKFKDEKLKLMSDNELKLINCYKKDNISLKYELNEDGSLKVVVTNDDK